MALWKRPEGATDDAAWFATVAELREIPDLESPAPVVASPAAITRSTVVGTVVGTVAGLLLVAIINWVSQFLPVAVLAVASILGISFVVLSTLRAPR